jgi:hypothetical protein
VTALDKSEALPGEGEMGRGKGTVSGRIQAGLSHESVKGNIAVEEFDILRAGPDRTNSDKRKEFDRRFHLELHEGPHFRIKVAVSPGTLRESPKNRPPPSDRLAPVFL